MAKVLIKTSEGDIKVRLYDETPQHRDNFIKLAKEGYFDGTLFHRVIKDFMIQGGDPLTKNADTSYYGTGGPEYRFADEFNAHKLVAGSLAMANSGPATNGSQFFIVTLDETPWLDGKHTVFGHVVEGQDVVDAVAQGDVLESLEIIRVGAEAEQWNAVEAFRTFEGSRAKRIEAERAAAEAEMEKLAAGFEKTESGLRYQFIQRGSGKKAEDGKTVSVHYSGQLPDGKVFDSSYARKKPIEFPLGRGNVIEGWDEGIALLQVGDKARFVIPSHLGYGSRGAGGVIPPNATLIFDVELMDVK